MTQGTEGTEGTETDAAEIETEHCPPSDAVTDGDLALRQALFVGRIVNDFSIVDESGDGSLTSDEVPDVVWNKLSVADSNTGSALSSDELTAYRTRLLDQYFADQDANSDGALSNDEVSDRAWHQISQADSDASDTISLDELVTYSPTMIHGNGHHHR